MWSRKKDANISSASHASPRAWAAQAFSRFGEVLFAKVVLDPATRRPRGTAFVRFATGEAAAAVRQLCRSSLVILEGKACNPL